MRRLISLVRRRRRNRAEAVELQVSALRSAADRVEPGSDLKHRLDDYITWAIN